MSGLVTAGRQQLSHSAESMIPVTDAQSVTHPSDHGHLALFHQSSSAMVPLPEACPRAALGSHLLGHSFEDLEYYYCPQVIGNYVARLAYKITV
mgnify:FL=1